MEARVSWLVIVLAVGLTIVQENDIWAQGVVQANRAVGGQRPAAGPNPAGQQRQAGVQPVGQPGAVAGLAQAPPWVALLTPEHKKFVTDILTYWEQRSDQVKRYRCQFKRWEFDPVFGPSGDIFKTYAEGQIQYSSPDKGMFRTTKVLQYAKAAGAEKASYEPREELIEHWICDGKAVFEFDYQKKQLIQSDLPTEMQGTSIAEGPLPFLFGAKADDILTRYWVRVITPTDKAQGAKKEYWLEAVPKTQRDAANYKLVQIYIDGERFLPQGMVLFGRSNNRLVFQFEDREDNFNIVLEQLNIWNRAFYEPKTPGGWEKIVHPVQQASVPPQQNGPSANRR